jgi:hypothetical protein
MSSLYHSINLIEPLLGLGKSVSQSAIPTTQLVISLAGCAYALIDSNAAARTQKKSHAPARLAPKNYGIAKLIVPKCRCKQLFWRAFFAANSAFW